MELEFAGRRFPVSTGDLVIGADPGADVVLAGALPRHAVVRALGDRMATIRASGPEAAITVNGVACGPEPTPLMDGDSIAIGSHELKVLNPTHPGGGPNAPPPGARERLHDTLFGLPKSTPAAGSPAVPRPAPAVPAAPAASRMIAIAAAVVAVALLAWLLLR